MNRIFVCSPLAARGGFSTEEHQRLAELLCLEVAKLGHSPFASHLLFTRFLNDSDPRSRQLGMNLAKAWMVTADEVWVFARANFPEDLSTGMDFEVEWAKEWQIPVVFLPECWAQLWHDTSRLIEEGPRTLMFDVRRTRELRDQAEAQASIFAAQAGMLR